MQFPKIITVEAISNYKLHIQFSDKVEGDYDIGYLAGKGVFKNWDKDNNFYKVSINPESGAITWPGELDIDTVKIYCDIKGINADDFLMKEYHASY